MMLNVGGEGRMEQAFVNLNLHELPPVALRALDPDLGSVFHNISPVAQGPLSDLAAFLVPLAGQRRA
jgi:hypothetical protein